MTNHVDVAVPMTLMNPEPSPISTSLPPGLSKIDDLIVEVPVLAIIGSAFGTAVLFCILVAITFSFSKWKYGRRQNNEFLDDPLFYSPPRKSV